MAKKGGAFAFELSKPTKRGTLMKQGSLHKAFKYRFFVLYPGFLVYYETETKWKTDLAKGQTLGNRIGAIKLKNGTANPAKDAPKGCKYGLIVHAPDPVNKRQSYLLNALNKGDRDEWIHAVRGAIPKTPKPERKMQQVKEEEQQTKPKSVIRQDTATAAALLDSDNGEEEKETSIDSFLTVSQNTQEEEVEEEEGDEARNEDDLISQALGSQENDRNESSEDELPTDTPTPSTNGDIIQNGHSSPLLNGTIGDHTEPERTKSHEEGSNGTELESKKKIESSMDIEGKVEVVTSVKVQASGSDQEDAEDERRGSGEGELKKNGDEVDRSRKTSEVAISEAKTAITITMVRENTVGDVAPSDTESDDDSSGDDSLIVPPPGLQDTEPSTDEPSDSPDPRHESSSSDLSTPSTPVITINKVPTLKRNEALDQDVMTVEEEEEMRIALQAKGDKRRTSAPFIEKKGFLYKEGGQRKTWKLRYFVLQPGMFSYYKSPTTAKPLGEVKLKNLQIRYPSAGERKQSFQFVVHTESNWNKRNDYVIASQSNQEMKEWVQAFKLAGQKNATPSGTPSGSPAGTPPENSDEEATPTS